MQTPATTLSYRSGKIQDGWTVQHHLNLETVTVFVFVPISEDQTDFLNTNMSKLFDFYCGCDPAVTTSAYSGRCSARKTLLFIYIIIYIYLYVFSGYLDFDLYIRD